MQRQVILVQLGYENNHHLTLKALLRCSDWASEIAEKFFCFVDNSILQKKICSAKNFIRNQLGREFFIK